MHTAREGQREVMDDLSFLRAMTGARRHSIAVTVTSGHQLRLQVQSVGTDWFSGFPADGRDTAVVVRVAAVSWISGLPVAGADTGLASKSLPMRRDLALVLSTALRRRPVISVHCGSTTLRGRLVDCGTDFAVVERLGGDERVVPFEAIEWLEVH